MDPNASRETLDHSIMYIFAVALLDGRWHHVDSYTRAKAQNPETISVIPTPFRILLYKGSSA